MRSAVIQSLHRQQLALRKAAHYFAVIALFALGAGIGARCVSLAGMHTIWLSCLLLAAGLGMMFFPEEAASH